MLLTLAGGGLGRIGLEFTELSLEAVATFWSFKTDIGCTPFFSIKNSAAADFLAACAASFSEFFSGSNIANALFTVERGCSATLASRCSR